MFVVIGVERYISKIVLYFVLSSLIFFFFCIARIGFYDPSLFLLLSESVEVWRVWSRWWCL